MLSRRRQASHDRKIDRFLTSSSYSDGQTHCAICSARLSYLRHFEIGVIAGTAHLPRGLV